MKKINKTRYAILGMLFGKSMSGYQIRQFMLESTSNFWSESDASIYPMLKLLESEGKVTSKSELKGERESRKFAITKEGKKDFLAWMELDPERANRRSEFLLKLFFGATASPERALEMLSLRLERVKVELEKFKEIEKSVLSCVPETDKNKIFWGITLRNGIFSCEADIKWIKESIKVIDTEFFNKKGVKTK